MGMTIETSAESGLLRVNALGRFSLVEAQRTLLEMLEAVARHKVKKVLFDGRKLAGEPKTMERFFYSEFAVQTILSYKDRGVSSATRFAYVLEVPMLDPGRFGETVAVNRGLHFKAFDNLQDALGWLGMAPANTPNAGDG